MAGKKINLPPLEVNPLIKLFRWTSLIAGIIYGFNVRGEHTKLEKAQREYRERNRIAREKYLAREKLRLNAVEMRELEKIFLGTVSSDSVSSEIEAVDCQLNETKG